MQYNRSMVLRIIRRAVYVALVVALVYSAVKYYVAPNEQAFFDSRVAIESAMVWLLVWCSIFTRAEPTLTRIALVIALLAFSLTIYFWDANSKHGVFSRPATQHLTTR
jgi:hypothetical protein